MSSQVSRLHSGPIRISSWSTAIHGLPRCSTTKRNRWASSRHRASLQTSAQNDAVLFTLVDPAFLEGTLVAGYIENLSSTSAAMQNFRGERSRSTPREPNPSSFLLLGYADALVTMEVLRRAGANPTRERVLEVLTTEMAGYDAEGLLVPRCNGRVAISRVGVQGISVDRVTGGVFVRVNEYFEPGE